MAFVIDDVAVSEVVEEVKESAKTNTILGDGTGEGAQLQEGSSSPEKVEGTEERGSGIIGDDTDENSQLREVSSSPENVEGSGEEDSGICGDYTGEDAQLPEDDLPPNNIDGTGNIISNDSENTSFNPEDGEKTMEPESTDPLNKDNETSYHDSDVRDKNIETPKTGGSYGELKSEGWGWNSEPPKEVHHMPSNESSTLETKDGPAIVMDSQDHRQTASCGNSRDAKEYRAKQKDLIDQGKFREAMQMDIDDIRDKFGNKYDEQIKQMLDYVKELENKGEIINK